MTIVCRTVKEWIDISKSYKDIGFVPTMGNLHSGHESLIIKSRQENSITVVSIFVNPTQFNDKKDFNNYPKTFDSDLKILEDNNVDVLFLPDYREIYLDDFLFKVMETNYSNDMEGEFRPGHFDGVLTVVMKLFQIIKPNKAYFGEKDYQQLNLIKQMVDAFFLEVEIIGCPTVRNSDGLALSSRNNNLTEQQKLKAANFYKILSSNLSVNEVKQSLTDHGFKVDYVVEKQNRRFGAIWLDNIRLIDNVVMN